MEEEEILCGNFTRIPPGDERCVRVFLCADPLDSLKEREALRRAVSPKLREYSRRFHGLEFQLVDGYDGIHPTEFYSSRVRRMRMDLLQKCLRSPLGPCFVALIGEEYGRPCLPTQISAEEFENILHVAGEKKVCTKVLERWYLRDENAAPPVYNLLDMEENRTGSGDPARDWMCDPFHEIRLVFKAVVPLCVEMGILQSEQADKYFNSALEEELLFAFRNRPDDLLEKCICYIHRIPYKAILRQRERSVNGATGRPAGAERLCYIRDTLLPSLARAGGLHVYSTTTTCDVKVGYTEEKQRQYVAGLCRQLYGDLAGFIQRSCPPGPPRWKKMSTEEASRHLSLCTTFADLQQYEAKEAERIKDYIVHDGARGPLVVYGGPGCGKTALVASCAKKVHFWLQDSAPVLIVRFVPVFGEAVTLQGLLSCLCQQVADIYQAPHLSRHVDAKDLRERFAEALSASTEERPLVLMLDAVDRLRSDGNLQDFQWLPSPMPRFTKVVLSVTQDCDLVKSFSQRRVSFLQIKPSRKECNEGLKSALTQRNRKITSGQQLFVNRSLESNPSPLQMLMLFKEVIEWKSHQEVDDRSLGGNTYQIIERFLQRLEVKYGYAVLSRAVSYITLSRSGVGEAELIDLMSADDGVLTQLYHLRANVGALRVPDWLVACILLDLKSCLSWRTVTGFRLLCWTNEIYQKVTYSRYLSSPEVVHKLHVNMCHYFSGRWACGRSKPLSVEVHNKQNEGSDFNAAATRTPAKIYVDCQLPSQPWFFTRRSRNQTIEAGNVRKAYELPFHLKECGKLDSLFNDIVLAVPYHKVLIKAGLLRLLLQSMEEAAGSIEREEAYIISDLFKEIGCVLIENPDSMEFVLQSKMTPLVHTYPGLLKFVKQTYCEGAKRPLSLNVLCSPLIQVVPAKVQLQETSRVISVLEMETKRSLIVVFENGSIWTWGLPNNLTFRYQLPGDAPLERAIVELNGRYLALVTKDRTFVILDCSSWTLVCAIKNIIHGKTQEIELIPKNIHLVSTSLFVCYENSSMVRIYNVQSGAIMNEIIFPQVVTFFGCESSAKYTILGQTNKILIYDNKNFDLEFDLNVDLLMFPISDIYMQDHLVYIIDKASNIMVWDTEDPTEPQLMDEIYTNEVDNEMMSSEITPRWLLIGRSKTIDVWDVLTWEKISFEPPGGTRFLGCVLSESCEEIIAAVEGGSSIFVWDRESGQCLSVIRQEHGEFTLFAKCPQLGSLIAATTHRFLLRWDLKSVVSTTCLSQTGRSVELLLLCPRGSAAFTADGSEIVCKWDIPRNKIRTCFLHNDLVAMMALTASGELLVTSVASGDLFVWVTESGENVQYIQCGPISQMLIAPNASVMVCMCQDGLTRVWNPATGNIVCNIRVCLHQAAITPGGTFLIGLDDDKLLAVSLWSGSVCKQLRWDTDPSGSIDAFRCMESHPDFVVVLTSGAELYTWDVVEDTVCHQLRLPIHLSHPRRLFQVSANGGVVVITVNKTVNVFNTQDGKLGVFCVPNPILHQRLTGDGKYFLYTCHVKPGGCNCDFHTNPVLNVISVRNGEKVGRFPLGKMPSAMMLSEDGRTVCIGFEDGTVGLYSLVDTGEGRARTEGLFSSFTNKGVPRNVPVGIRFHKQSPDVIWSSCTPETYNSDSG